MSLLLSHLHQYKRTPSVPSGAPPLKQTPPPDRHPSHAPALQDTVNKRAVRILLECILISICVRLDICVGQCERTIRVPLCFYITGWAFRPGGLHCKVSYLSFPLPFSASSTCFLASSSRSCTQLLIPGGLYCKVPTWVFRCRSLPAQPVSWPRPAGPAHSRSCSGRAPAPSPPCTWNSPRCT